MCLCFQFPSINNINLQLFRLVHSFRALPETIRKVTVPLPSICFCVQIALFLRFRLSLFFHFELWEKRCELLCSVSYPYMIWLKKSAFAACQNVSCAVVCCCFVYSLPTSHKSVYDIVQVIFAMFEISVVFLFGSFVFSCSYIDRKWAGIKKGKKNEQKKSPFSYVKKKELRQSWQRCKGEKSQ